MSVLHRCRGFSANLAFLFKEHGDLLKRIQGARKAGFEAVEISTPELFNFPSCEVGSMLRSEGLRCVLFNMPAGDWQSGDRGLAALPHRRVEFQRSIDTAQEYARHLDCPRVHCLAGLAPLTAESEQHYRQSLSDAVEALGSCGVEVLIEPINQRSMPDYYLCSIPQAVDTIKAVRASTHKGTLKLLFDIFHGQILHGDISTLLRRYWELVGHIQIAGVPDRTEPDSGQELNYPYIFQLLRDELGYDGHIGCEYNPRAGTEAGLGWLEAARPGATDVR